MTKNVLFFHHQIAGRKEEVQRTCQCSRRLTEKFARVLKISFNYLDNIKLCLEAKTNKHNLNIETGTGGAVCKGATPSVEQ
jgi:hypothetical protein